VCQAEELHKVLREKRDTRLAELKAAEEEEAKKEAAAKANGEGAAAGAGTGTDEAPSSGMATNADST
jgi:hypothetical protein